MTAPKLGSDGRWRLNGRLMSKADVEAMNLLGVSSERRGGWMQTFTGRQFWPLDPRPEDICIEDIAHHLALTVRYNGAPRQFYSVAQHSALVAGQCGEHGLWGLLHDAPEAYLGDMIRPLKHTPGFGDLYREAEAAIMACVVTAFGLDPEDEPESVKLADARLLATEKRDLLTRSQIDMDEDEWLHGASAAAALPGVIRALPPLDAEHEFLRMYKALTARTAKPVQTRLAPARGKIDWAADWVKDDGSDGNAYPPGA